MDPAKAIWKLLSIICSLLLVAGGGGLLYLHTTPASVIAGIYVICFSLLLLVVEFYVPSAVEEYAKFLFTNAGRGISYIVLGGLTAESSWWLFILTASFAGALGIVFMVTAFIPQRNSA